MEHSSSTRKKINRRKIIIWLIVIILLILFCYYENNHLVVTYYTYSSSDVCEGLDGYRIVQLSDLHNATFGAGNSRLLDKVDSLEPDMVVLTGDIVDGNRTDISVAVELAKQLVNRYPTYYITGNHEYFLSEEDRSQLIEGLKSAGVVVLDSEVITIDAGEEHFYLAGLDDEDLIGDTLDGLIRDIPVDELIIVLAHEPDFFEKYYSKTQADLVLSGHAHGGQFRLPFIGPVVAPGQGFNPEYAQGEFELNGTTMIVSRGLGNSIIPLRLFNDPEIVCVDLKRLSSS
ncbi:MAG: metallophosphoesterase [Lachnospiraceae bacterium]|nr:metallophosphoesterase [Lachnospiraceae bacterium]